MTDKLDLPPNITIVPLPPKCPELIQPRMSGSSCAKTGSPTASSNPMTTSSITAATHGTRRSALGDHVHRAARLGPSVLISAGWYYASKDSWTVSGASKTRGVWNLPQNIFR